MNTAWRSLLSKVNSPNRISLVLPLWIVSGNPIHRHNDRWIIEHERALALLGLDTNTNCGPAHFTCAQVKTHKRDWPRIRKAKRQQVKGTAEKFSAAEPKPRKAFTIPAGVVHDLKQRRYIFLSP
jgi:hypothetical protein